LDYNEEETTHRHGVVVADLNRYVCKKYHKLKDTILRLAERVAFQLLNSSEKGNAHSENKAVAVPQAKKNSKF
jgi:hypothetical protein